MSSATVDAARPEFSAAFLWESCEIAGKYRVPGGGLSRLGGIKWIA
jgi:hypothetical protein